MPPDNQNNPPHGADNSAPNNTQPGSDYSSNNSTQPKSVENSNADYEPTNGASSPKGRFANKKKLFGIVTLISVLFLGAGAAAYFQVYLPNQPENAWNKSLENTADGYDMLVSKIDDQNTKKGAEIKGSFKGDAAGTVADGNFESKFSDKNSVTKLDFGTSGFRFNVDALTHVNDGATNPDIYLKVTGLKGLDSILGASSPELGKAVGALDNQWYVIDHTLLDQWQKEVEKSNSTLPQLTKEDYKSIAEAVGRVNREYLFTEDQNKAVLVVKENVGKEKIDDRSVYHYKVGYNKEHLKAYSNALKDELKKTKLKDNISDADADALTKQIDKLSDSGQADAWVDLQTKTFRRIRFYTKNPGDNSNYVDVGMKYVGGDEIPFELNGVQKESDDNQGTFNLGMTFNKKTNIAKFNADISGQSDSQKFSAKIDGTYTPTDEDVKFTKPENTKSALEAIGQFTGGQDPASLLGTQ